MREKKSSPVFSVIIPSKDRLLLLEKCLSSISRQSLAAENFEVIVVDDGSSKPLHESLALFKPSFAFSVIRVEGKGPAAARNSGAAIAMGEILAFLDDDCEADVEWLSSAKKFFEKERIELLEGATLVSLRGAINALSFQRENISGKRFLTSNIFYSKGAFNSIRGFDESFSSALCEDTDLAWRATAKGFRAGFCREAVVFHSVVKCGAFSFAARRIAAKWPYWNVLLASKHPQRYAREYAFLGFFNPVLVPHYPLYFGVLFFIFSPFTLPVKSIALFASYALAVFFNALAVEGMRKSPEKVLSKPLSLLRSFSILWLIAFSDFFASLSAAIKFRKVLF